jgi:pyridoxamine 5'-phosphate oxidase
MNPLQQLADAKMRAIQTDDPNAPFGALATASPDGQPSVRTVIVHAITDTALFIAVSRLHRKWHDMETNGRFEMMLWYPVLSEQYRVKGHVEPAPAAQADSYWQKLPREVQLLDRTYEDARLSPGDTLANLDVLKNHVQETALRYPNEVPTPDHVAGLHLVAEEVEALIASTDRLHTRQRFWLEDNIWQESLIVP